MVLIVVMLSGCLASTDSSEGFKDTWTISIDGNYSTTETSAFEKVYENTIVLNGTIYICPYDVHTPVVVTISLDAPSHRSISYVGIITATDLNSWLNDSEFSNYVYVKSDVVSGTYTVNLQPGVYYFVVGLANPVHEILASDTVVVNPGEYVGIPVDLTDILYATNLEVAITVRENSDISIYFMNDKEFQVYKDGGTSLVYSQYHKVSSGLYMLTKDGSIGPGFYYLVFDNSYSLSSTKTIDYIVSADIVYPLRVHLTITAVHEK